MESFKNVSNVSPMDVEKLTPNFVKIARCEFGVTGPKNLTKMELTEMEKAVIQEQFDEWCMAQGVFLEKEEEAGVFKVFCSAYLCGMILGAGSVSVRYESRLKAIGMLDKFYEGTKEPYPPSAG